METTSTWQRIGATAVHVYTASGAVIALLIVLAAIDGETERALWLMLAALVIDGTDGMLARWMQVKERIPWFDGARLDDIVDYLTYVFAPVVLLWTGEYLPDGPIGAVLAALPLLSSSYQFCRSDAKSDDHHFFFMGFPSYWNVLTFYVVVLGLGQTITGAMLLVCSVLVFVPVRYVYPSRTLDYRSLTLALTVVWLVAYAAVLWTTPEPSRFWLGVSLLYLVYYAALSLHLTLRRWRVRRPARTPAGSRAG